MDDYSADNQKNVSEITVSGGTRIGARLLDMLIELIIYVPIALIFIKEINFLSMLILVLLNVFFEFVIPVLTKGKTIGKAIVGIRIVSDDGEVASNGQLFIRSIFYTIVPFFEEIPFIGPLISFCTFIIFIVSLVLIFSDDNNQAVHDKLAGVYVVYDNE